MYWNRYFESVGDVWLICVFSVVSLTVLVMYSLRRLEWRHTKRFLANEEGASYVLPFVLTLPAYLFFICAVVQGTMILLVKMGTVYAAYAAVRAEIVWQSFPDQNIMAGNVTGDADYILATAEANKAAKIAMTPWASGFIDRKKAFPNSTDGDEGNNADLYYQFLNKLDVLSKSVDGVNPPPAIFKFNSADTAGSKPYTRNKYLFAARATSAWVKSDAAKAAWNDDVPIQVRYKMPMQVPLIGVIFGNKAPSEACYSRVIVSTVTLPSETPETPDNQVPRLGIDYDPRYSK